MDENNNNNNIVDETSEASTTSEMDSSEQHKSNKLALGKLVIVVVLVLLLGAGAYFTINKNAGTPTTVATEKNDSTVVATINGKEILQAELDDQVAQLIVQLQSVDPESDIESTDVKEGIRQQALDNLINIELLVQEAQSTDIKVNEAAVTAQYLAVVERFGGDEGFEAQIKSLGLTSDDVKTNIRNQLAIQDYLDAKFSDIEVTEEEAKALYDEVATTDQNLPPYEEVKDQVLAQVRANKEQVLVETLLIGLREKADIEISE